jgi:hypothetical protein
VTKEWPSTNVGVAPNQQNAALAVFEDYYSSSRKLINAYNADVANAVEDSRVATSEPQFWINVNEPRLKILFAEISHRAQERAKIPERHEHATGTSDLQCELCNEHRARFEIEFAKDERTPELLKMFGR